MLLRDKGWRRGLGSLSLRPQRGSDSSSCPTKQPCAEGQGTPHSVIAGAFYGGGAEADQEVLTAGSQLPGLLQMVGNFFVKGGQSGAAYFASGSQGQGVWAWASCDFPGLEITKYWHRFSWKVGNP